ncbi:MAG: HAMP domain-containing sensor histidine kinase [Bacteroidota bacterium]
MKAWKNHQFSFVLAAGSLLLLLLFQVFWLSNIYQNEKENLREEADLVFNNAIRSIEDSLLMDLAKNPNIFQMFSGLNPDMGSSSSSRKVTTIIGGRQEVKMAGQDTVVSLDLDLRTNFQEDAKRGNFGSVALLIAGDTNNRIDRFQVEEGFSNFVVDTAATDYPSLKSLDEKLQPLIAQSDLPPPFELIKLEGKKIPDGELYSNPHKDILSSNSYAIYFPEYQSYILKAIAPQIFFSVLLFGAIVFSFFMMWQSLEKQRRLTALKNDFISNVTHELKTPITTVGVALEALSNFNALKNPERTEEYLNISKHELQRLSILVDKVLKMSLFEKQEPELKLETFDMHHLVQDVLHSMKLQFEKFSADVNFHFEGANFYIKGDKIHLTNVVYNLIDNALKYSKEKPVISLLLKNNRTQIQLIVKDQGIGIAPNLKDKIFEKFFRVPQGDRHDVKGYGLGLSYVAGVVKKHQGRIEVDSQEKQGTVFTISLPTNYE